MEEKNQKTIVAFIAGLLIGGLLVWVFFVASDNKQDDGETNTETTQSQNTGDMAAVSNSQGNEQAVVTPAPEGQGAISIADQKASARVAIESFTATKDKGWIAIQDVNADGSLGRILGAARFSLKDGLVPKTVELLRATVPGTTYRAVIYGDNGDKRLETRVDGLIVENDKRIEDSFTATK